ncbi:MAG: DUF418 domain-containing protein [Gemmatimonadetes bacterium]|nr:DUF418 domain-containing protein [Gemmatimonadota bacterium]MYG20833.1 DUF418 domain-containing protein [Gemmatimonadota bacterium]MYJ40555.1 DUF418 domain-containing protein [Gemmatimonadota bacterium]
MNSAPSAPPATPVTAPERIASIDVLRGFAVLGILIVNMQGFARVPSAYMNPASGAAFDGAEAWIWTAVYILADTKFISIFSMLFGAGIAMMSERMASRGVAGTGLHYRRQSWLLVIGLVHAYLIWHGDILVAYALCGLLLYPLRKLGARALLWIGGCAVAFVVPFWLLAGLSIPYWPEADRLELLAEWAPPQEVLESEIAAFRGGLGEQLSVRAPIAFTLQISAFLGLFVWRAGGLMLVGMGLYKLGVLAAARSATFYRRMAVIGIGAGLPLAVAGAWYKLDQGFAFETVMFQGALFNYVGSVGVFLGYLGLVMLMVQFSRLPELTARLAATGRMALTNYIAQSVICTLVFYGHGLGLFERVAAPGRMGIVFGIWALQLLWSPWWLKRFRFGPLEWLWRSATYMKRQPMRV